MILKRFKNHYIIRNTKRCLLGALTAVLPVVVAAQRVAVSNQVIDCGQVVYMKPVTAQFELVNEGKGNVTIKGVEKSCGCTTVSYPRGPITENKPFVVSATYDARMLGHFEKYIDLYTTGASLPITLTIKGVVVDEVRNYGGDYGFMLGKLKADKVDLEFDDVNKGERPMQEIHILNTTGDIIRPVVMHLPDYLKAEVSPSAIPPGKQGVVQITLESKQLHDYGLTQTTVYLGQNPGDRTSPDKEINVWAVLLPAARNISERQLAYSPKLKISDAVLNLGSFDGKKKKKGTITIENVGRTDLDITALQMFTAGLSVELSSAKVAPGESVKLKVTADRKTLKDVRQKPRILMITNDPVQPKVIVTVDVK